MSAKANPFPARALRRRDALLAAGAVLLTLVARCAAWSLDPVVSRDGATYVILAERFNRGEYGRFFGLIANVPGNIEERDFTDFTGQEQRQHPLFPLAVALAARLTGDGVTGGKLVSLILGTLTVVPLFLLTRRLFGPEAAVGASVLFAFHAYMVRESVDVLTEPTFLFFFTSGLWLIYESVVRRSLALTLAGAVAAGLAYLVRPEGFGLLFILLGAIWLWRYGPDRKYWTWRVLGAAVALAGFFVVALPYLVVIHEVMGVWWITMKKPPHLLKRWLTTSSLGWMPGTSQVGPIARDIAYDFWKAFHPLVLLLSVAGATWRRAIRRSAHELYLAAVFVLYLGAVVWLREDSSYVSRRHFFPLVVTSLPFAGAALVEIASWFARRRRGEARRIRRRRALLILLALCALVLALKTYPGAVGDDYLVRAGRRVAEDCPPVEPGNLRLMTAADSRIAFYAGAEDRCFPLDWLAKYERGHHERELTPDIILAWAKRQKPPLRWLVVQPGELREHSPGLLGRIEADERFRFVDRIDRADGDPDDATLIFEMPVR